MILTKVYVVIGYDNIDYPVAIRVRFCKHEAEALRNKMNGWRTVAYACIHERFSVLSEAETVDPTGADDAERKEAEEGKTL